MQKRIRRGFAEMRRQTVGKWFPPQPTRVVWGSVVSSLSRVLGGVMAANAFQHFVSATESVG